MNLSAESSRESAGGPLAGLKVLELAGLGPCPFAAMVLSDMGADVLRVERASLVLPVVGGIAGRDVLQRGKRSVGIELKEPAGAGLALSLARTADVLVEGFRPGVAERLGIGPQACLKENSKLVYGRMTGWGQEGPLSGTVGHDIDYIALAGVLDGIGREGSVPVPPLNLIGDFGGGGMLLVAGVLAALVNVARGGEGQVVDASMVEGAALLSAMTWSLRGAGVWKEERGTNLLDSGAPFYEVYECADGRFVAVGAIEPAFYSALVSLLGLDEAAEPPQMDRQSWPEQKRRYAAIFRTKSREEWVVLSEELTGGNSCLAPVLTMTEAPEHPHNRERHSFVELEGVTQPAPAPRFGGTPAGPLRKPCRPGEEGRQALSDWGVTRDELDLLERRRIVAFAEDGAL